MTDKIAVGSFDVTTAVTDRYRVERELVQLPAARLACLEAGRENLRCSGFVTMFPSPGFTRGPGRGAIR